MSNKIRSVLLTLAVLGGTGLFLSSRAVAQHGQEISVLLRNGEVRLNIRATTPLGTVLAEFCKRTSTICEGTDLGSNVQIAPLSVSGSWQEVVSRLLQGSGLDFIASAPSAGSSGTLILQLPSAPTTQEQTAAVAENSSESAGSGTYRNGEPQVNASATLTQPESEPLDNSVALGSNQSVLGSLPTAYPFNQSAEALAAARKYDWPGNPLTHDVPLSPPEPSKYLLFPGPNGELIPATEPGPPPGFLPWPDGHGGLLPAPPVVGNSVWPITYNPSK